MAKPLTVLVIDDEASIREITKTTLENHNYRVVVASDGTAGIATFLENKGGTKLVLTDMGMPYMDGPATIRARKIHWPSSMTRSWGSGASIPLTSSRWIAHSRSQ